MNGQFYVPVTLPAVKSSCYVLFRKLGGSQIGCGRGGEVWVWVCSCHESNLGCRHCILQSAEFNVTHFESRITHLLHTAINTTEHGQVTQCLRFTKSLMSSIQRLGDVLHDNQGIAAISQVHVSCLTFAIS